MYHIVPVYTTITIYRSCGGFTSFCSNTKLKTCAATLHAAAEPLQDRARCRFPYIHTNIIQVYLCVCGFRFIYYGSYIVPKYNNNTDTRRYGLKKKYAYKMRLLCSVLYIQVYFLNAFSPFLILDDYCYILSLLYYIQVGIRYT